MNFHKILFSLAIGFISISAYSETAIEKIIRQEKERIQRRNTANRESAGDYSQSEIDQSKLNSSPKKSTVTINGELDIKGIKIGMNSGQVSEIIKKDAKDIKKCGSLGNKPGAKTYPWGDLVLYCKNSYSFFGTTPSYSEFYFVLENNGKTDRLILARLGLFFSNNNDKNPMPEIVKALSEKYGVSPEMIDHKHPNPNATDNGTYEFIWGDSKMNKFIVTTEYAYDLSGVDHRNQGVTLISSDFDSVVENRKLNLKNIQNQQINQQEKKKKSDL